MGPFEPLSVKPGGGCLLMRNQSCHGLVPQVWGERSADTVSILTHVPAVPAGASETSQPLSLPQAIPLPKSPIWSIGHFLMVHLLCFKY